MQVGGGGGISRDITPSAIPLPMKPCWLLLVGGSKIYCFCNFGVLTLYSRSFLHRNGALGLLTMMLEISLSLLQYRN